MLLALCASYPSRRVSTYITDEKLYGKKECHAALRSAIQQNSSLEQSLPLSIEVDDWAQPEEEVIDIEAWFQTICTRLQARNGATENHYIHPVGSCKAAIGVIIDNTPFHDYGSGGKAVNLPWGLQETGFNQSNSLIWSYNLESYVQIPKTFQAAPPRQADIRVLREATQTLIRGSHFRIVMICGDRAEEVAIPDNADHLRIVMICGDRVEEVAIPDNAESKRVEVTLQGRKYNSWVDIHQSGIKRLFIRSRQPLSRLWSSHGRQAFDLTNIFRFVSSMMGIKIFAGFYESALSLSLIDRKWTDERDNDLPKVQPPDLEPILKALLANKSFQSNEDLDRLIKAAGGSLRYGILVLSLIQEKEKPSNPTGRIYPSSERRCQVVPRQIIDNDRDVEESDIEKAAEKFGISKEPEYVASGTPQGLEETMDRHEFDVPAPRFDKRLSWILGAKYKCVGSDPNSVRIYFRYMSITIPWRISDIPNRDLWLKAELSPIGKRHPNVLARLATDIDPGSRLAIRCSFIDQCSGKVKVAYAHSQSRVILCKANTLVDELNGDDFVEICQRPRRFMYVDPRCVRQVEAHPELRPFVNGAYTDDNGKIIRTKGEEPIAQGRDRRQPK
ncbi:hypothetical protein N7501_006194 [Penicillium viridicatum]|nr:hypothetical protein N7501_006194 [Penicillium viridicatum]